MVWNVLDVQVQKKGEQRTMIGPVEFKLDFWVGKVYLLFKYANEIGTWILRICWKFEGTY